MADDPLKDVRRYYDIVVSRAGKLHWELRCKKCGVAYTLRYSKTVVIGNVLALLNHAETHQHD